LAKFGIDGDVAVMIQSEEVKETVFSHLLVTAIISREFKRKDN
jgi:hypothetical protein